MCWNEGERAILRKYINLKIEGKNNKIGSVSS